MLFLSAPTTQYGSADIAVTLSQCICGYVCVGCGLCYMIKRKTPDRKWLETWHSSPRNGIQAYWFCFKRSNVRGTGSSFQILAPAAT